MNTKDLKKKYLEFFKSKGHAIIKSAPLIPENDPTVLFTTAGMHPLVPFLLGNTHPLGKRLTNVQKCIRTQDIDEVGDETHTTCFEMLGNWSLGDYFKKEAISWSYEFLTKELNLDKNRLAFTCFIGDDNSPKDNEAYDIWISLGISKNRIAFLGKKDNWWGPAGETGPCGPDTEMFYWKDNNVTAPEIFDPNDKRWVEIWNDVFMQYNKNKEGKYEPLNQKNVDTGLGVERVAMALQGKTNIFEKEVFSPIINKIEELASQKLNEQNKKSFRIIADHIKAATFILGDERGVVPSNVDQGYILRRYLRRIIRHLRKLNINSHNSIIELSKIVVEMYKEDYPEIERKKEIIFNEILKEQEKFEKTLVNGLKEFEKFSKENITGNLAFLLFQSYGFPIEMTVELANEKGIKVDVEGFDLEYKKHQELSRVGAEKKFKGGLSDNSEVTIKLHTATHLLNEALRRVLGNNVKQKGSNITPERLRFDFNFDRKLTPEEISKIEEIVNELINNKIQVIRKEMTLSEAKKLGAQAEFDDKYAEKISVYIIEDFSIEVCMGPHVNNTYEIGKFKIIKEESAAAGIRRIKAIVE